MHPQANEESRSLVSCSRLQNVSMTSVKLGSPFTMQCEEKEKKRIKTQALQSFLRMAQLPGGVGCGWRTVWRRPERPYSCNGRVQASANFLKAGAFVTDSCTATTTPHQLQYSDFLGADTHRD